MENKAVENSEVEIALIELFHVIIKRIVLFDNYKEFES